MRLGPFKIAKVLGNNTFVLHNLEGEELAGPISAQLMGGF